MTDREKLIEVLGKTPGIGWSDSARQIIADHLIANGVTISAEIEELKADNERLRNMWAKAVSDASKAESKTPKWIPVTERLPEDEELVLCVGAKGGMFIGYPRFISHEGTAYTRVPNARGGRYTKYWMPLPEPPKGD